MMIMKKILNSFFVIIAAMITFAGCVKEEPAVSGEAKTVEFVAKSIETKTHFGGRTDKGTYPTFWDEGDKVKVLLNLEQPSGVSNLETSVNAEISEDAQSARFKAELNKDYAFKDYTFYAVVPATAYNAKSSSEGRFTVEIYNEQTPQEEMVDKKAQVIYAISETTTSMPSSVQMNFKHFTAYGKLSLSNLTDKVNTVSSISLEFADTYLAGKWNYLVADGSKVAKEGVSKLTLITSSTENLWFACAPADVSNKELTLTVNTEKGPLVKKVTFPKERKFESGKVSIMTVDMDGVEPEEQNENKAYYEKVTSEPTDWSGKYLIVWGNNAHATLSGKDLISTAAVTIVDDKITALDAVNAAAMTVTKSGSNYNMKYPDGKYFSVAHNSASSSTNPFALTFAYTSAGVKISGQATNSGATNTYILYNNNNQYYRCYVDKSNDAKYTLPTLFKYVGNDDGGETPDEPETPAEPVQLEMSDITCSAQTENSLTFTWTAVANATGYEVTCNNKTETVAVTTTQYVATDLAASTSYTISIVAVGDGANYTNSAPKTQTGTTSAASTGGGDESSDPVTVSKNISDISGKPTDGTKVSTMTLDNVITASASTSGNNGKVYSSGAQWRLYQSDKGTITISAKSGYTIKTVKFTYTTSNSGVLKKGSTNLTSGTTDTVNASSVTYSVGNTGSATNGQVRVTAIEVVYQKD